MKVRSIRNPVSIWIQASTLLLSTSHSSNSNTLLPFRTTLSTTTTTGVMAFQGPMVLSFQLPKFLTDIFQQQQQQQQPSSKNGAKGRDDVLIQTKQQLLQSISSTSNGKNATPTIQRSVLSLVRKLETTNPPPSNLFTDPQQIALLDGVWYLKYTSPSSVPDDNDGNDDKGDDDDDDGTTNDGDNEDEDWKPTVAEDKRIETKQIQSKGSVSAGGITVDVSDRDTLQIFSFFGEKEEGQSSSQPTLRNEVDLGWGKVVVGGGLRPSDVVYNRAVASFTECKIQLSSNIVLDLSFLFSIRSAITGTKESGWLETTYVDEDIRIGRGNKGTMFVLTRDKDAVR